MVFLYFDFVRTHILALTRFKTFRAPMLFRSLSPMERPAHSPYRNTAFSLAFPYLSSHLGNHSIVRIRSVLIHAIVLLSDHVQHEKFFLSEIPKSASFLTVCPKAQEIEQRLQRNNTGFRLFFAASRVLLLWHISIEAYLRHRENNAHPLDLVLICL